MKAVFFSLLLLCSVYAVSADLEGSVDVSGQSYTKIKISSSDLEGKAFSIAVSGIPTKIEVRDKSGLLLNYSINQNISTEILVTVPVDYVEFQIWSDSFTSKNGSEWIYDFTIAFSEDIDTFNAKINLPKNAMITKSNGAVNNEKNSLSLSWTASLLKTTKANLRAVYTLTYEASGFPYLLLLIPAAIILYFIFKNKQTKIIRPTIEDDPVFKTLDETDKEIVKLLYNNKGKSTQASIYLHTHIPKATLSRRLNSLENKGIIKRSQKGNRKLITLAMFQ
ncbi:MAG: winged helix-turn-helix transcriptional regulator [Candidatus Micrarchaeota archaeon]